MFELTNNKQYIFYSANWAANNRKSLTFFFTKISNFYQFHYVHSHSHLIQSNQKRICKAHVIECPSLFCAGRGTNHWTVLPPHRDYCGPASNLARGNGLFLQAQKFNDALQVARLGLWLNTSAGRCIQVLTDSGSGFRAGCCWNTGLSAPSAHLLM